MQDPTAAGDEAIAAFFLNARQSTEDLVGDILAQAQAAKPMPLNAQALKGERLAHKACGVSLDANGLGELI